jgi:hypothetical protein
VAKKRTNYATDRWDPSDRAEVVHVVRTTVGRYPNESNRYCGEKVADYVSQAARDGVEWADRSLVPVAIVGTTTMVRAVRSEMATRTIILDGRPTPVKQIIYYRDVTSKQVVPTSWWEADLQQWKDAVARDMEMAQKPRPAMRIRQAMLQVYLRFPDAPTMRAAAVNYGLDPDKLELGKVV